MTEIKFRVWNKAGNNMLYDIDNVFECLKQQIKFDESMPDRDFNIPYDHRSDGMEWMQFIGQKDISLKDIYEGDILRTSDGSICYVVFEYSGFAVKSPGSEAIDWEFGYFYSESEIIGNIHQNPELCK